MPILAPNLSFEWLLHGFGERDSVLPGDLTTVKQIHSGIVIDAAGRRGQNCGEGDALLSDRAGVTVGVKTADCVPVLIADEKNRAVAAVHAGWRGTAENIVGRTLALMAARFGSTPENLHAAIGPAIGACCYEVSPEVAARFGAWVPEWNEAETSLHIDLVSVNRIQLVNGGVKSVWSAGMCTKCMPERFWSFRGQKEEAGRMMSFIGRVA